jgi:hypothetical protein
LSSFCGIHINIDFFDFWCQITSFVKSVQTTGVIRFELDFSFISDE